MGKALNLFAKRNQSAVNSQQSTVNSRQLAIGLEMQNIIRLAFEYRHLSILSFNHLIIPN